MSDKQPIVEDVCRELRKKRKQGSDYKSLESSYTMELEEIVKHVIGNCACTYGDIAPIDSRDDEPWREEYVIRSLYREKENQFVDMAKILDCHSETAKKYVDKFNVSPIDSSNRTSSTRVNKLQRIGAEKDGDIDIKEDS
jgi:hypothetical protein